MRLLFKIYLRNNYIFLLSLINIVISKKIMFFRTIPILNKNKFYRMKPVILRAAILDFYRVIPV
jgi:hypothetical protein